MARGILVDELELTEETTRYVLRSSLAAAHVCAQQIDQRAQDVSQSGNRERLCGVFSRIANCATRMTASRRHALDSKVRELLRQETIDWKSIEVLIEILMAGFGKRPKEEASLTVLRSVMPRAASAEILSKTISDRLRRDFVEAATLLKDEYAALSAVNQRTVESALIVLGQERRKDLGTADVCRTLSRALAPNSKHGNRPSAADLIIDYVAAVAKTWRQHGLRPSRARNPLSAAYRSRFHRFADLILTSVVEPWSKRHDGDQNEELAKLRKAHALLPKEIRRTVRAGPRRTDVEWLVADDHLKKVLAAGSKNGTKNTV